MTSTTKTFTATDSDGKVHTRNSKSFTFTHAVLCRHPRPEFIDAHKGADYAAIAWSGNAKTAAARANYWREVYTDIEILPASLQKEA